MIEQASLALRKLTMSLAVFPPLPLRLIVGYGFFQHGLAKWSKGPDAFALILHATGVPAPHLMAWLTIATEILSGLAFLLGAFVSLASVPAIVLLAVAIFTVHLPYGFSSIKLLAVVNGRAQFGPPGYECDLLYIACIVALVLGGAGPWSIDTYRLRGDRRFAPRISDEKQTHVINQPVAARARVELHTRREAGLRCSMNPRGVFGTTQAALNEAAHEWRTRLVNGVCYEPVPLRVFPAG